MELKNNECNENAMDSFICRLFQAIEYKSSKSFEIIQNKRKNNEKE